MLCTFGSIVGQLLAGVLADVIPMRLVIVLFAAVNLVGIFAVVLKGRKSIAPIYNLDI
jgi:hypothetical protein